jgi:hypothetical protein
MKRFIHSTRSGLFAALAGGLAVFSGCQNTEEIASLSNPLTNVTFAARTNRSLSTRVAETMASDVTGFNVFGIWSEGSRPLDNLAPAIVSGGNGVWEYNPKQYWPESGTIDFFAYSPDEADGLTVNYSSSDYDDMSIAYTVPDIENQEDLLVAVKSGVSCTRPEEVTLTFQHALSRIQLKARPASSGTTYNVHSVAFLNLSNSGKLELNPANIPASDGFIYDGNAGTRTPLVLWTDRNTAGTDYVFDFDSKVVVSGSAYSDIITGDESLLVLPQTTVLGDRIAIADEDEAVDPTDGKFYVKIVYSSTDASEKVMVKYFAVREPLNPALNKPLTFEIGRSYTFVVDLSGSDYVNFADVEVTGFDGAFGEDLPETNINDDPDPARAASYTPKAHKGFAGSNIYWDDTNQRLTFDDVDVTTHKNYQGLYFKWGSLIGISPSGDWGGATVLYSPDGINGMYRSTTATDLVSGGTWANIAVGDVTSFSTTPIDGVSDYRTNGYVSFLNATPANLIAYKGDICAYLSGRPGVPAGYWRLPVSADFEPDTFPNPFTSPGQYTRELGGLLEWPVSATSDKVDGTFVVANGYTLTYGGSSTVFFPASGYRNASTGALNGLGLNGYAWSSSAGAAYGRNLSFNGSAVTPASSYDRAHGLPARCVKK